MHLASVFRVDRCPSRSGLTLKPRDPGARVVSR
jgi:hypothetical protein